MRKALTTMLVAALALGAATAATAHHKPGHGTRAQKATKAKVAICHRGHTIRVSERAVAAHVRHGDLVGACNSSAFPAPDRRFVRLHARLRPVEAASGSGNVTVGIARFQGSAVLCYVLSVRGVDATAAHVHTSVAQTIGNTSFAANAIVVPLKTPADVRRVADVARGCMVVTRAMAATLVRSPGNFYVNVHSQAFPNGQVQGTLARRSTPA